MGSNYRNELDAALQRAESLEKQNQQLNAENQQLRGGVPVPQPRSNAALVVGGLAGALVLLGGALTLLLAVKASPPPTMSIPESPTPERTELAHAALNALRPALSVCTTGLSHSITVSVTFDPNGTVSHAQAMPPAEQTPVGQCVARVVNSARIAPFSGGPFTLMHPFIL